MGEHCRKSLCCQCIALEFTMSCMDGNVHKALHDFVLEKGLPESLLATAEQYLMPLTDRLAAGKQDGMQILGINGAQGSGKSTLAELLAIIFRERFGWKVAVLSMDDLYLSRAVRQRLAQEVHPLLATRGVPGTHDVQLGLDTIAALRAAGSGEEIRLPRFDKANDEPVPLECRQLAHGQVDLLIFEGWCLGALPQADSELAEPCNDLERIEDAGGVWRRYVNRQLTEVYPSLFSAIDYQVFLKVPDFDAVLRWRGKQEDDLRAGKKGKQVMDRAELERFVQHFERLTRSQLISMPVSADVVFELDQAQRIAFAI